MAEARTIKFLKREALATLLAPNRAAVLIPTARAVLGAGKGNKPTLNHAFVAAVLAGAVAPLEAFTLGEGWGGDHHGGSIGQAGDKLTGRALLFRAVRSEVEVGMCGGGREFFGGYQHAYLAGLILGLRHGEAHAAEFAERAIAAHLALGYLLTVPGTGEVIEIGGRATGGPNTYSAILQELWRGDKDVRVPRSDAAIACQMFEALTPEEREMLPAFPQGVEDAVAILEGAKVVCPAGLEWWGGDGWWRAQVNREREWFIKKRTGEQALLATAYAGRAERHPDRQRVMPIEGYTWNLTLDGKGLTVHRRPGEGAKSPPPTDPDKPTPPRRPPEPGPPDQEPDLAAGVRAVIAWAKDPQTAKGRGSKSVLAETAERLEGLL